MKKTYYRGDVYMADLGQGVGSEQGGSRPVVIVQNDTGNHYSPTVIVAAMTSKGDSKAKLPTHFTLEGFTQVSSLVLCEPKGDPAAGLRPGCEFWPAKTAEEKKKEGPQIFFDHDLMPLLC